MPKSDFDITKKDIDPTKSHIADSPPPLDLRGTYCPMAFVKARMFLDAHMHDQSVIIIYENSLANEPLARSIASLGHIILESQTLPYGTNTMNTPSDNNPQTLENKLSLSKLKVQVQK